MGSPNFHRKNFLAVEISQDFLIQILEFIQKSVFEGGSPDQLTRYIHQQF
jgi:hypothetical protein